MMRRGNPGGCVACRESHTPRRIYTNLASVHRIGLAAPVRGAGQTLTIVFGRIGITMADRESKDTDLRTAIAPDGAKLFYEVAGSGPPLVLLHGTFTSRVAWNRQRSAL